MEAHKTLPHSDALERSLLGAAVHFEDARSTAIEQLNAEDFYTPRNAELFSVLRAQHKAGVPCDAALTRAACVGRLNALELLDGLEIGLHPDHSAVCVQLRDLSAARRITRAAFVVAAAGIESSPEPAAFLESASRELTRALDSRDSRVSSSLLSDLCAGVLAEVDQTPTEKAAGCLRTGIYELDRVLGGLENGRLYVVAGRPGMGKSALAVQLAEEAARQGSRCAVFSLEMPSAEIARRMVCSAARVNSRDLGARKLDDLEARRMTNAAGALSVLPIVFPEAMRMTIEQIARVARQEKLRSGLGLVLVDYLQLIRSSGRHDNREQEVSEISRELKLLARELDLPVVAVSQLSRKVEERSDKRPMLSDLRESGAIEQDADAILFLFRPDYYSREAAKGLCEVIVGKNRGGETGFVRVNFEAQYTRFSDVSKGG